MMGLSASVQNSGGSSESYHYDIWANLDEGIRLISGNVERDMHPFDFFNLRWA